MTGERNLERRHTMNTNAKKTIGAAMAMLLITVCFFPGIAGAFPAGEAKEGRADGPDGHHRPPLGFWRNTQLVKDLGLTDEQVKQVREADFSYREKHLALRFQLDGLRLQMDKAFSADTVDKAAVRQLAAKIADTQGQMFVQDVEGRLMLGEVLNADQIDQLKKHEGSRQRHHPNPGEKRGAANPTADKPCEQKVPMD
jgi:Spy/CpxP family protein refolding chaperone